MWERTAIDCLVVGCEQLYTEVFRATALDGVTTRAQAFFAMMPNLEAAVEDDSEAEA